MKIRCSQAHRKLIEETKRAERYLESSSLPALKQQCVDVLVTQYSDVILAECRTMIRANETERKDKICTFIFFQQLRAQCSSFPSMLSFPRHFAVNLIACFLVFSCSYIGMVNLLPDI